MAKLPSPRLAALGRLSLRRRDLLLATGLAIVMRGTAAAEPSLPRRLRLKNAHTGESFDGPYRDADGPIPEAMGDLAAFLRDHHANKIGPVDVTALDFLADVMAATGHDEATILSAYRTPETNAMLRARGFGVAERSQHLLGRALDVAFDNRLVDAEAAARAMQRGGVGWYPRSHFVHLDSGPVRSWEMDDSGLDRLLIAGRGHGRIRSVRDRIALHRALARREFLQRH
jgi:uncharacterized protein YcbK (DUF882 family)